jgi:hypothetical protein
LPARKRTLFCPRLRASFFSICCAHRGALPPLRAPRAANVDLCFSYNISAVGRTRQWLSRKKLALAAQDLCASGARGVWGARGVHGARPRREGPCGYGLRAFTGLSSMVGGRRLCQMLCFTMGCMLICEVRVSAVVRKSRFFPPTPLAASGIFLSSSSFSPHRPTPVPIPWLTDLHSSRGHSLERERCDAGKV